MSDLADFMEAEIIATNHGSSFWRRFQGKNFLWIGFRRMDVSAGSLVFVILKRESQRRLFFPFAAVALILAGIPGPNFFDIQGDAMKRELCLVMLVLAGLGR